jgi:2-polyprenyl-6-methoxyphenol hydroxylase-like FAD-dependent oxidoreductase
LGTERRRKGKTNVSSEKTLSTPVAIVGGGPVGLMLALFLDHFGVSSTVFNTEKTTRWHPKGNGQNARTMEHYRLLGLVDQVRALGIPVDHPFDHAVFTRLSAHEIFRFRRPTQSERLAMRRATPVTDQYVEPMYHVNQMYVESAMLEHVKSRPNITLRFGWQVRDISQTDEAVVLLAREVDSDREETWCAAFAAGCDGARGLVRKTLGIRYEGDVRQTDYFAGLLYSVYMRIPDLLPRFLGHRRAWMYWMMNADAAGVIISLNGRDEFMMLAKPNRDQGRMDRGAVEHWVKCAIGEDIRVEIIGHQSWNAGAALVAERYVAGRIALVGDAVHLFTPTGGFGMSTGLDDASNLGWKLAALVQGWGGPYLLESYQAERKPIGYRNTGAARQIAKAWHAPVATPDIEREGPAGDAARREAAQSSFVTNNHFFRDEEVDATGVQLGARYDGSPIIVADGAPPPENFDVYAPSGVPGGRAPHLWLDEKHALGSSLFDRLCPGFTLLRLKGVSVDAGPLARAAGARGIPFAVLDIALPEAHSLYERSLALVRPDQYIAWRGDRLPADPDALLARVTGHERPAAAVDVEAAGKKYWAEDAAVD